MWNLLMSVMGFLFIQFFTFILLLQSDVLGKSLRMTFV